MAGTEKNFQVRNASVDDMSAVDRITRTAYEEYAAIMDPIAWEGLREAVEEGLASRVRADTIVADLDDEIVGSVMLFPPEAATYGGAVADVRWPEIRLLAVAPSARGMGIARALVSECLDRARKRGFQSVGLHTSRSMRIAVEMYRRMGFVRAPEFDFQPPGDELVEAFVLSLPEDREEPAA